MAHERVYVGREADFPDLPRENGDKDRLGRHLKPGDVVEFDEIPPADDTRFVTKAKAPAKRKPESEES